MIARNKERVRAVTLTSYHIFHIYMGFGTRSSAGLIARMLSLQYIHDEFKKVQAQIEKMR